MIKRISILFFVPVIAMNWLLASHLPEVYSTPLDHPVVSIERIIRILLIVLSLFMLIDTKSRTGRLGIMIYVVGLVIYLGSWIVLLRDPTTDNPVVLLSGYWSAVIWPVGIGLSSDKLWIRIPWRRWIYITLSVLFGVFHIWHGYLLLR